MTYTEVQQIKI